MSTVTKFFFENSFDAADPAELQVIDEEAPPPEPTFSEAELHAARRDGYEEGHKAGAAEVRQSLESAVAGSLGAISDQLGAIAPLYGRALERSRAEAIDIARAVTRKMIAAQGTETLLPGIEALIASILPRLIDEPRVVVRVSDSLLDPLQERIPGLAERCGFPGSLILISEPDLADEDCRVEWADGGAERDAGSLWTEIDTLIERYVAGLGLDDDSAVVQAADAAPDPTGKIKPEEQTNG